MSCSSHAAIIPILPQVRLLIVQMLKMVDVVVEAPMILLMLMVDFPLVVMLMELQLGQMMMMMVMVMMMIYQRRFLSRICERNLL